jgi:crotonobetaine/carnitine-CoA ligase
VAVVPPPSPLHQEEVVAVIVPQAGVAPSSEIALSIMQWALQRIAYCKTPGGIVFIIVQ